MKKGAQQEEEDDKLGSILSLSFRAASVRQFCHFVHLSQTMQHTKSRELGDGARFL